jgi:cell division protein FtsA
MKDIIVAIDVGTSKVGVIIGVVNKRNEVETLGKGFVKCHGIKKGIIADIEEVEEAIKSAISQAENKAKYKISSAYVSVAAMHVNNKQLETFIDLDDKQQVSSEHIEKLFEKARQIRLSNEDEIIDIIPQNFIVDDSKQVQDPRSMKTKKLGAKVNIVFAKRNVVKQIMQIFEKVNIHISGFIVDANAIASILLTENEKKQGVLVLDVGGNITNISVFKNMNLIYSNGITVGGEHIINDISIGLEIPQFEAERLKRELELGLDKLAASKESIQLTTDTKDKKIIDIKISEVVDIIQARLYEILSLSKNLIETTGMLEECKSGIIVTGAGIANIIDSKKYVFEIFSIKAKEGIYKSIEKIKAEEGVAYGMIDYVSKRKK